MHNPPTHGADSANLGISAPPPHPSAPARCPAVPCLALEGDWMTVEHEPAAPWPPANGHMNGHSNGVTWCSCVFLRCDTISINRYYIYTCMHQMSGVIHAHNTQHVCVCVRVCKNGRFYPGIIVDTWHVGLLKE